MTDYLQNLKVLGDKLAAIGEPLTNSQLIHHAFNGLGPDYDAFSIAIITRTDGLSFASLQGMLITHENCLLHSVIAQATSPFANLASKGKDSKKYNKVDIPQIGNGSTKPSKYSNNPCQICRGRNHFARYCQKLLAHIDSLKSPKRPQSLAFTTASGSNKQNTNIWFPDSGATHHLTSDLNKLQIHSDYDGYD
ncbi:PREDICTED: uncharacterized protein LOC104611613 [Nelumbo nucifera]|uniref:Uncharacterized protein LOC104611613 n=1 Tax=Nelumbo nucifera TaxID=4432 RepID=A0A1U8BJS4_NELNU|nr:PREDICTED: uncharacterized protein LOC104611613 [Nelumbo nucifera]